MASPALICQAARDGASAEPGDNSTQVDPLENSNAFGESITEREFVVDNLHFAQRPRLSLDSPCGVGGCCPPISHLLVCSYWLFNQQTSGTGACSQVHDRRIRHIERWSGKIRIPETGSSLMFR